MAVGKDMEDGNPCSIHFICLDHLKQKILTWDNIIKRGKAGPHRCVLCKDQEEIVSHLFFKCPFSWEVWDLLWPEGLPHRPFCTGDTIQESLDSWHNHCHNKYYILIPLSFAWGIWITINFVIFNKKDHSVTTSMFIIKYATMTPPIKKEKKERVMQPLVHDPSNPYVFCGGASQGNPRKSGVVGTLILNDPKITYLRGMSHNTKNYGELLCVYTTLSLATKNHISSIQIMSNSKWSLIGL